MDTYRLTERTLKGLDHNPSMSHLDISCNELGEEAGRVRDHHALPFAPAQHLRLARHSYAG